MVDLNLLLAFAQQKQKKNSPQYQLCLCLWFNGCILRINQTFFVTIWVIFCNLFSYSIMCFHKKNIHTLLAEGFFYMWFELPLPSLRKFQFSFILSFKNYDFWNPCPWNFQQPSLGVGMGIFKNCSISHLHSTRRCTYF